MTDERIERVRAHECTEVFKAEDGYLALRPRERLTDEEQAALDSLERELTDLRHEADLDKEQVRALLVRASRAQAELAAAREVVEAIDPDKLDLLADWFDQDDANKGRSWDTGSSPEVQADLRRWARLLRSLSNHDEVTR